MDEPDFARLSDARVAVVGLGLMGGSLALALRGHCRELLGTDMNAATLDYAREHAVVDQVVKFDAGLDADLIILAVPVRAIVALLAKLPSRAAGSAPVVILDLGSTKSEIAGAMQALPPSYDPIGGHPMCGKEVAGLNHADAALFQDKVFVLSPLDRTTPRAVDLARQVTEAIGARPVILPAARHDRLAAASSHLPYAASVALVRAAESLEDDQVWELAASGFRDTSRLAASDVTMMTDILLTNRAAILDALERTQAELVTLAGLLEAGEADALSEFLSAAAVRRRKLFQ
jgi:prephenate dehydrogenase